MNGKEVHLSGHGPTRVNKLLIKPISNYIPCQAHNSAVQPTATPFASACSWYLAIQSRTRVGTPALRDCVSLDFIKGRQEQNRPVDIVSSLLNTRFYNGVSINCVDNTAKAHLGPTNNLSQGLSIIRCNNLEVYWCMSAFDLANKRAGCILSSPGCTRSGYSFLNFVASFSRRSRERPATDHLRFVGNLAAMCVHTIVPV